MEFLCEFPRIFTFSAPQTHGFPGRSQPAPAMLRHGTQLAEQGRFVEAAEAFAAAAAAEATPEAFEALAQCGWAVAVVIFDRFVS